MTPSASLEKTPQFQPAESLFEKDFRPLVNRIVRIFP